jgi:hypothetical protein
MSDAKEWVDKAVKEAFEEAFDGLYMGCFTPDELDLVLEALKYYAHRKEKSNPDKAEQVACLLEAMIKLKEEGEVK